MEKKVVSIVTQCPSTEEIILQAILGEGDYNLPMLKDCNIKLNKTGAENIIYRYNLNSTSFRFFITSWTEAVIMGAYADNYDNPNQTLIDYAVERISNMFPTLSERNKSITHYTKKLQTSSNHNCLLERTMDQDELKIRLEKARVYKNDKNYNMVALLVRMHLLEELITTGVQDNTHIDVKVNKDLLEIIQPYTKESINQIVSVLLLTLWDNSFHRELLTEVEITHNQDNVVDKGEFIYKIIKHKANSREFSRSVRESEFILYLNDIATLRSTGMFRDQLYKAIQNTNSHLSTFIDIRDPKLQVDEREIKSKKLFQEYSFPTLISKVVKNLPNIDDDLPDKDNRLPISIDINECDAENVIDVDSIVDRSTDFALRYNASEYQKLYSKPIIGPAREAMEEIKSHDMDSVYSENEDNLESVKDFFDKYIGSTENINILKAYSKESGFTSERFKQILTKSLLHYEYNINKLIEDSDNLLQNETLCEIAGLSATDKSSITPEMLTKASIDVDIVSRQVSYLIAQLTSKYETKIYESGVEVITEELKMLTEGSLESTILDGELGEILDIDFNPSNLITQALKTNITKEGFRLDRLIEANKTASYSIIEEVVQLAITKANMECLEETLTSLGNGEATVDLFRPYLDNLRDII